MSERIVTLGSCYVDINVANFPFGTEGIPLESELIGGDYELVAGGSAVNFCRKISELGILKPSFLGVVGNDEMGEMVEKLLEHDGTDSLLLRHDGVRTAVSFNMTSGTGQHVIVVAGTANAHMDESILPNLDVELQGAKYLYLGGAFKLKKLQPYFGEVVRLATAHGVQIVVDHGRVPEGSSKEEITAVRELVLASQVYVPSRDEFAKLWDVPTTDDGMALLRQYVPDITMAVKDGGSPVKYQSASESGNIQPPRVEAVGDVTGAGDTFNAGFLSALASVKSLADSVTAGCELAAKKVTQKS